MRGTDFVAIGIPLAPCEIGILRFGRLDHDISSAGSAVDKLDHAAHLGKQGVIFAPADVRARLDAGAALAHDDGAARNQLSAECFYSQPLRVRVATVSGTS